MTSKSKSGKITIREYRDTDYDACLSLWKELSEYHVELYKCPEIGDPDPGQGLKGYLDNPTRKGTWVAEIDGKVVGFSGLLVESPAHSELEPMIVSEKYRGRGVSTALMQRVVTEAKKTGVWFISVHPGARNKVAFNRYVKGGFKNVFTVGLIQELNPPGRPIKWLSGIKIHDTELGS
jgi:GNAT superfamily N-acetyltransferase